MANLILTRVCNQGCPYCFAQAFMTESRAEAPFISLDGFRRLLDLIQRSGGQEVRLLGGEPSLHPEFPALLKLAVESGLRVLVFSNGMMPKRALAALATPPGDQCLLVLNVETGADQLLRLPPRKQVLLATLGRRLVLGYNIHRLPLDLSPLLRIWQDSRWGPLAPFIRLGLAHPIRGASNVSLHPKNYPVVGARIARFADQCTPLGLRLQFDCGFVRCMFDDAAMAALVRNRAGFSFHCRPILDLGPGDESLHCFALARDFHLPLQPRSSLASLRQEMEGMTRAYQSFGIYRACSRCPQKAAGQCDGGCLSIRLGRLRRVADHFAEERFDG